MPTTLRIKRRSSSTVGAPSTLASSELAFNETSGGRVLYYGLGDVSGTASSVIAIGGPDFVSSTIPNLTGVVTSVGTTTSIANAAITNAMLANTAVANLSGTNTGDNAVNSLYSGLVSDKTVVLTAGTGVTVTGTYPSFTIAATGLGGTVTSVSVVSANGFAGTVSTATSTPAITISTSITGLIKGNGTALSAAVAATDYVAPGGALGTPSSGTLTNCTFPTLNQNTTGTASNVTGIVAVANGGTGSSTAANARTALGVAIGSDVQAWDADLDAIGAIAGTSGLLKKTAANTWTLDTNSYASGTVTSVGVSVPTSILSVANTPVTTSGTIALSLATQTANYVWSGPTTGAAATPTFRALVANDIPSLSYLPNSGGTVSGNVVVTGTLEVQGSTTTINSSTLVVTDKNIELGKVTTPSESTANGGGITLKSVSDHTILYTSATTSWDFSEHVNLASGKEFKINGTTKLSATALIGVDIDGGSF
jgi:hypothetical protein